jgi:hypothetical protein
VRKTLKNPASAGFFWTQSPDLQKNTFLRPGDHIFSHNLTSELPDLQFFHILPKQ